MTGQSRPVAEERAAEYRSILKRTYLFLRFGLVGTVIAIFLAVCFTPEGFLIENEGTLRSISHYYYTPARTVFTGALCAASLALVAIAGKGIQSYLLDLAALLAPLIAIIPTPTLPGEVGPDAGLAPCPTDADCIPGDQFPAVATGFQVWLWMSIGVMVIVAVRNLYQGARRRYVPPALWVILALGLAAWAAYYWLWTQPGQELLRRFGHVAAASTFFVLIAVVALIEAWRQWADRNENEPPPPPPAFLPRKAFAWIYLLLGIVMFADIACATFILARWIRPEDAGINNSVFIVEVVGLIAFALFWLVQTAEHGQDPDGWEPTKAGRARMADRQAERERRAKSRSLTSV
jgi:CDP-diglyceride synthetase